MDRMAMVRQATRYLVAAEQDRHPVIAYLHASYAVGIFDMLEQLGQSDAQIRNLRERATLIQDRSGTELYRAVGQSV